MPAHSSTERRVREIIRLLHRQHPHAHCELHYTTPLELAIGAILSAQCTDKRVNLLTPPLFKRNRCAADWCRMTRNELELHIHSAGFFRNKARHIHELCATLEKQYGGEMPEDFDALVALPGIGRKTANLIRVEAWKKPGIIVDTHCTRVANRLGLTQSKNPEQIERELGALVPRPKWGRFSHSIVIHGRYICKARNPDCDNCLLCELCPYFLENGSG